MKNLFKLFFGLFSIFALNMSAQDFRGDVNLLPLRNELIQNPSRLAKTMERYQALCTGVFEAADKNPYSVLCYMAIPSFGPAYSFSVTKKDGVFSLIKNRITKGTDKKEAVQSSRMEVTKEFFDALDDLFRSAISTVETPRGGSSALLDGTNYGIYCGFSGGRLHSPNKGSRGGRLVELCDNIARLESADGLPAIMKAISDLKWRFN